MISKRDLATISGVILTALVVVGVVPYLNGCAADRRPAPVSETTSVPTTDAVANPVIDARPPQAPASSLPDSAEAHRLASSSFMRLAAAIKTKDFAPLYQTMAPTFRSGFSVQRVADGFRPFTGSGVDLTAVNSKLLVVTPPPSVNERGVLIIKGFQPTAVQTWYFEFGFLPDEQSWALTALSLSSTGE